MEENDSFLDKLDIDLNIKPNSKELLNNEENEINNIKKDKNEKSNELFNKIKNENKILFNEISELKKELNNIKMNVSGEKIKNISVKIMFIIMFIIIVLILSSTLILIIIIIRNKMEQKNETKTNEFIFPEIKSVIIEKSEENFILSEIEKRMNKKIKKIKKIYQATIDGGNPRNFHLICDFIPNTLVLIKSEAQRRFGGFTPISWRSVDFVSEIKDNRNQTFIFSIDNKKVYSLKKNSLTAVCHASFRGPSFGYFDIVIMGDPIREDKLRTNFGNYDHKGDRNTLSGENRDSRSLEYEVFQVKFY